MPRESSELSGSDEPYFIVSLAGTGSPSTVMHRAKNVDKGDERVTLVQLGDNFPVATSVLHVAICENDEGSPSEARQKVAEAMADIARAAQQAAAIYDVASSAAAGSAEGGLQPAADIAGLLVAGPLGTLIARSLVAGLGLGDDVIGESSATLFDRERGYADYPAIGQIQGEHYTHKLWIEGKSEGNYEVYLRVHKYGKPRPLNID